jgi:quercetin dioxygenase-like cupin family protein
MKIENHLSIRSQLVDMPGSQGCRVRWLVGEEDGAPNFAMRQFEVDPGGFTPRHSHPYEHEVFVLEGQGVVMEGEVTHELRAGDVVYVHPDEVHQFRNTGTETLKFLCMVPHPVASNGPAVPPECGTLS